MIVCTSASAAGNGRLNSCQSLVVMHSKSAIAGLDNARHLSSAGWPAMVLESGCRAWGRRQCNGKLCERHCTAMRYVDSQLPGKRMGTTAPGIGSRLPSLSAEAGKL